MLGSLTNGQIEQVMCRNILGRLGCSDGRRIYIIPISFAYHNGQILCRAKTGKKIEIMRRNQQVCFLVDEIDNMCNWRSVLCWGDYEEIADPVEQRRAETELSDRFDPLTTSESARRPSAEADPPHIVEKEARAILFRINVHEKTGRYEKTPGSPV